MSRSKTPHNPPTHERAGYISQSAINLVRQSAYSVTTSSDAQSVVPKGGRGCFFPHISSERSTTEPESRVWLGQVRKEHVKLPEVEVGASSHSAPVRQLL
eukprot:9487276-Pyramimonas_sp.AAC.1